MSSGPCAGLGPSNLQSLVIQKEFIGTKEDHVLLDYPSPTQGGTSLFSAELSDADILKARGKCQADIGSQGREINHIVQLDHRKIVIPTRLHNNTQKKAHHMELINNAYFVELPEEREGRQLRTFNFLDSYWESKLVKKFAEGVTLKRVRSLSEETGESFPEEGGHKRRLMLLGTANNYSDVDGSMAEEAGLALPPPPR